MQYRAILNYDFTGTTDTNDATRLKLALVEAGWLHVETSAFTIETNEISKVWLGIELVAKQASSIGELSALTYHIQASEDFSQSLPATGTTLNAAHALADIKLKSFPS
jgi:hypothetical protein